MSQKPFDERVLNLVTGVLILACVIVVSIAVGHVMYRIITW